MKRIITSILVTLVISNVIFVSFAPSVFAQQRQMSTTILPEGEKTTQQDCTLLLVEIDKNSDPVKSFKENTPKDQETVLACAIKTGRVHFWMIPYFIVYMIEFLIGVSGLIAILFIVIGGYQLVVSGAAEAQKDKAKNTIKNALLGLALVLVAWVVVNVIQYVVTI